MYKMHLHGIYFPETIMKVEIIQDSRDTFPRVIESIPQLPQNNKIFIKILSKVTKCIKCEHENIEAAG